MYIYTYIYIHTYIYICMCKYTNIYVYIYISIFTLGACICNGPWYKWRKRAIKKKGKYALDYNDVNPKNIHTRIYPKNIHTCIEYTYMHIHINTYPWMYWALV